MSSKNIVQPYLSVEGRCQEAVEFYRKAIGAEVTAFVRFADRFAVPGMITVVPPGQK
jgi:PhnB protein